MNRLQRLKWDIKFWWIKFIVRHSLTKSDIYRRKYCAKGWHKLYRCTTSHYAQIKGKMRKQFGFEYLVCKYCDYKFFATVKDREKYNNPVLAEKDFIGRFANFNKSVKSSAERNIKR